MRSFLKELVAISSESKDFAGVYEVQKKLHSKLSATKAELTWLDPEIAGYAPALLAAWPSKKQSHGICLVTHGDTVYSKDSLRELSLSEDGKFLWGSGVADNKGGMLIACAAIEKLFAEGIFEKIHRPLYLFSSSCEEMGSPAFQGFIKEFSTKLDMVLGMEPALPDGSLIKKRRGNRYYLVSILGNSVHTGRDLKEAANPMQGVALLFELLEKLKIKHSTLSVSMNGIHGYPFKFNMSCEKIEVNIDTRFEDSHAVHAFHEEFMAGVKELHFSSSNKVKHGSFFVEIVDDCPAFDTGTPCADFEQIASNYSKAEGKEVFFGDGLGASDCCYFYRDGLRILDGLGPRGGKIHSPEEFIEVESLEHRAIALAESLSSLLLR